MDHSSAPPAQRRASSTEPSSTRPRPVDEDDASSRKRRRTSTSLSPTADPLQTPPDGASTLPCPARETTPHCISSRLLNHDPSVPRTNQTASTPHASASQSNEAASSKVTIRRKHEDDVCPPPDSLLPCSTALTAVRDASQPQISIEVSDSSLVRPDSHAQPAGNDLPSCGTTPAEAVGMGHEGSMDGVGHGAGLTMPGAQHSLEDPILDFPFSEPGETLAQTIARLTRYFSSEPNIDSSVVELLRHWVGRFLDFAVVANRQRVLASARTNHAFWVALPGIIHSLIIRRALLGDMPDFLVAAHDLCVTFAKLTAFFITLDAQIIEDCNGLQKVDGQLQPPLFSINYIQKLQNLNSQEASDAASERSPSSSETVESTTSYVFIRTLISNLDADMSSLARLTLALTDLAADCAVSSESLALISQLLRDIAQDSWRISSSGTYLEAARAKQRLRLGYDLWKRRSASLVQTIEKSPNVLNSSMTGDEVLALGHTLKVCCLYSDHPEAISTMTELQATVPGLSKVWAAEAISWQWRLDMLQKLVRSGQMQCRVMAVAALCSELVYYHRQFSDSGNEGRSFLGHIGEKLSRDGLIEYLLSPSCHPQIIVDSANIVGFVVVTQKFNAHHASLFWQGVTSRQDPRVTNALIRMIICIVSLFDYASLLHLYRKFQSLPLEDYTPDLRSLWENILQQIVNKCHLESLSLPFEAYDLCLRLVRESSTCVGGTEVAHPEMQRAALQNLSKLLAHGTDAEGLTRLYESCIRDLRHQSFTTIGSLWCLSTAIRHSIDLREMTQCDDFAELIVHELENATMAGRAAEVPYVISGSATLPRRQFITGIIRSRPSSLAKDLGTRLWSLLVGPGSLSSQDRSAGWEIILDVARDTSDNAYLQQCFLDHLPSLPPACFCVGMHTFIKEQVLTRTDEMDAFLRDDESASHSLFLNGIEQLWRIILAADDVDLARLAIRTLAIDVYISNYSIKNAPCCQSWRAQVRLVNRGLDGLKGAARSIRASSEGSTSGDDDSMVIVSTNGQMQEQASIFTRSLLLMLCFLEAYQATPCFATADLRLMPPCAPDIQGELAGLTYQSFDGSTQTSVKPLHIGKSNTVAALVSALKHVTEFGNCRIYFRGQPFTPIEEEICKTLEELHVHDGLILIKREENPNPLQMRIRPGCSPLEVEILAHFDELWSYLSLDEALARQVYELLIKLPAHSHITELIENEAASCKDIFPSGRPFKSLYALYALDEYARSCGLDLDNPKEPPQACPEALAHSMQRSTQLLVEAISDEGVVAGIPFGLSMQVTSSLMHKFVRLLNARLNLPQLGCLAIDSPSPGRLITILTQAGTVSDTTANFLTVNTLTAILFVGLGDREFWMKITSQNAFADLAHRLVLHDSGTMVRESMLKTIEQVTGLEGQQSSVTASDESSTSEGQESFTLSLWAVFSQILPDVTRFPDKCSELFGILQCLLVKLSTRQPLGNILRVTTPQACELLLSHTSTEEINEPEHRDPVACGLISLLHLCMQFKDFDMASASLGEDTANELFWRHLFPRRRTSTEQPVFKVVLNTSARKQLGDVILRLVGHDWQKLGRLLESLNELVPFYAQTEGDPYHYSLPWQFDRSTTVRASCGYVGLRNLSNTCYLNSLLTQLYMNPAFRCFILSVPTHHPESTQRMLFQAQKVFGCMQESFCRSLDPTQLVESIKTYDDVPIDVTVQMDVDEFYNLLFDRFESQLLTDDSRRRLRSFYGGQIVQQVKSKECEHISERLEPFSAVQCDIKGKSSLLESLQAYVDGEILEGDNRYKCSSCDRHVDAVKRACLKDIPDHLIFHLKRFDFDLRTLQRSKINDYFSFPAKLDMRPYTVEHLTESVTGERHEVFELVGILVHSGTAETGHYYSYIKERPTSQERHEWIEFNDENVRPWDPNCMEAATFGGPDNTTNVSMNDPIYQAKPYSAYMLFYQRTSSLAQQQEEILDQRTSAPLRVEMEAQLREHLINENNVRLRRHCLFDPSYPSFVARCFERAMSLEQIPEERLQQTCEQASSHAPLVQNDFRELAMEVALSHLDQIVSRVKEIPNFSSFYAMIEDATARSSKCAYALYNYFYYRRAAFRALIQRNPEASVRASTGHIIVSCAKKIATDLPHLYIANDSNGVASSPRIAQDGSISELWGGFGSPDSCVPVVKGIMCLFDYLWRHFHVNFRSWDDCFGTLLAFAKLGPAETAHVLADNYLAKLLQIITADASQDLPNNYQRMMQNCMKRPPPSFSAVAATMHYLFQQLEPTLGVENIVDSPEDRLGYSAAPFPWTAEEVQLVHMGHARPPSTLFVEKLLSIPQVQQCALNIMKRLMETSAQMETRIMGTLRKNLQGATSTQPIDPYLRASGVYVQHSRCPSLAMELIAHISAQAKHLERGEGSAFLGFMAVCLDGTRPDEEWPGQLRDFSLCLIPDWAPFLLVDSDIKIATQALTMLENVLFVNSEKDSSSSVEDDDDDSPFPIPGESIEKVVRKLAVSCLTYLKTVHVRHRASITEQAANTVMLVVHKCQPQFQSCEVDDGLDEEFQRLQSEVTGSLKDLIVDTIEENGSDWNGSYASSDQVQNMAEWGLHAVHDMDTTELE